MQPVQAAQRKSKTSSTLLALTIAIVVGPFAASAHETVSGRPGHSSGHSSGRSEGSVGSGSAACAGNVCLPASASDDDPTEGGRFPSCSQLTGIIKPSETSSQGANSDDICRETNSSSEEDAGRKKGRLFSLHRCLDEVRAKLPDDFQGQKDYISRLRSPRVKTFLASVFTTYGETTANMELQDHLAILKVISNRTRSCIDGSKPQATAWDIATSPYQFSMYNKSIYGDNGDRFIKNPEKNPARMNLALEAFLKFQCTDFRPPNLWENATHYHANYVNPPWAQAGKPIPPSTARVDGSGLATSTPNHEFYSMRWACYVGKSYSLASGASNAFDPFNAPLDFLRPYSSRSLYSTLAANYIFGSHANASAPSNWEIATYEKHGAILRLKSRPLIKQQVLSDPLGAKISKVAAHPVHKHIDMIEYDGGHHGTHQLVNVHMAVLFDTKSQKFLGDFPLRYTSVAKAKQSKPMKLEQPTWSHDKSSITIRDPESGSTFVIDVVNQAKAN